MINALEETLLLKGEQVADFRVEISELKKVIAGNSKINHKF